MRFTQDQMITITIFQHIEMKLIKFSAEAFYNLIKSVTDLHKNRTDGSATQVVRCSMYSRGYYLTTSESSQLMTVLIKKTVVIRIRRISVLLAMSEINY